MLTDVAAGIYAHRCGYYLDTYCWLMLMLMRCMMLRHMPLVAFLTPKPEAEGAASNGVVAVDGVVATALLARHMRAAHSWVDANRLPTSQSGCFCGATSSTYGTSSWRVL